MKNVAMKPTSGIEHQASRTALSAAMLRYMAYKDAHSDFPGTDHLSGLFLPPNIKTVLFFPFFRRGLRKKFVGGYEYVLARTNYFDELFERALEENIPQIVVLGAGYDTRAIRFGGLIQKTKIFELDAPHTQLQKQAVLAKTGNKIPEQLIFVPINFSTQNLEQVLLPAGYDRSQKTLFLWEGVTFYLTAGEVDRTLGFIRGNSGPGSRLAFDYSYKGAIDGTAEYYGAEETARAVSEDREPFTFGIEKGMIESFLADRGFELVSHHSPSELQQTFLTDQAGELYGRMYGFVCIVLCQAIG
jgi:methyltransferase (TIGR00027 family)